MTLSIQYFGLLLINQERESGILRTEKFVPFLYHLCTVLGKAGFWEGDIDARALFLE